jgi:hypothetical protein
MRTLGGCFAIVAALFLYAFAGAPAHAWSKPPEPRLRRFALIVSANDGGPGRVPLRFADSDAVSVADVLRKLGGLRDDDMILLTGARRAAFQSAFERMRAAIAAAGTVGRRELIVYYAGHSDEQGLLLGGERVGYSELRQWLDGAGAEVRIAILDSCASGSLIRLRGVSVRVQRDAGPDRKVGRGTATPGLRHPAGRDRRSGADGSTRDGRDLVH